MPLHDWAALDNWDGMHTYWLGQIGRALRLSLPPGYRSVLGTHPLVRIDGAIVRPDTAVIDDPRAPRPAAAAGPREPDAEVPVFELEPDTTVLVERAGRVVAVVELISPANKDRPAFREDSTTRYAGYLRAGVHLLLVDVHPRPAGFSYARSIPAALGADLPGGGAPGAVAYRVGPAAAQGGRYLAVWNGPFAVGEPLPQMPVPLTGDAAVWLDLEATYRAAAEDCYLA